METGIEEEKISIIKDPGLPKSKCRWMQTDKPWNKEPNQQTISLKICSIKRDWKLLQKNPLKPLAKYPVVVKKVNKKLGNIAKGI